MKDGIFRSCQEYFKKLHIYIPGVPKNAPSGVFDPETLAKMVENES